MNILLISCSSSAGFIKNDISEPRAESFSPALKEFLGNDLIELLLKSSAVNIFLLENDSVTEKSLIEANQINGFAIKQTGGALNAVEIKNLKSWIANEVHYNFQIKKRCLFNPAIAFQFVEGTEKFNVLVDFSCDMWKFQMEGEDAGIHRLEDIVGVREGLAFLAEKYLGKDVLGQGPGKPQKP